MMKRVVQILLLAALLAPALFGAEEESMEERKRRITRKYLRERMDMTYSADVVPSDTAEDDAVAESEKFRDPQVELEAEEPGHALPQPAPRPAPRTENRNWLLEEPEETADPFADPFAAGEEKEETEPAGRPVYGEPEQTSFYYDRLRESTIRQSRFGSAYEQQPGAYDPSREDDIYDARTGSGDPMQGSPTEGQGIYGPADEQTPGGQRYASPWTAPYSEQGAYSRRGVTPQEQPGSAAAVQPGAGRTSTYTSPFARQPEQQQTWSGYTPYQSPYRTQYEQRQRQWQQEWGQDDGAAGQYRRQDAFQQWKGKSSAPVNPMSDDAYVDEMMPQTRR